MQVAVDSTDPGHKGPESEFGPSYLGKQCNFSVPWFPLVSNRVVTAPNLSGCLEDEACVCVHACARPWARTCLQTTLGTRRHRASILSIKEKGNNRYRGSVIHGNNRMWIGEKNCSYKGVPSNRQAVIFCPFFSIVVHNWGWFLHTFLPPPLGAGSI